jgi:hypothetical protein
MTDLRTDARLGPLARLIGTWRGAGRGEYPTIEPFTYTEEIVLADPGRTFLAYTQRTWDAAGLPKHSETGYLRAVGGRGVEWVIVSPTGVLEALVAEEEHDDGALVLAFAPGTVVVTPSAKPVTGTWRRLRVDDASLDYSMDMAAVGLGRTFHLAASLARIDAS